MGFNSALSGIQAASADLGIIGNNVANAATTGFKESRAEFGDVYASLLGASDTTIGSGVKLQRAAQQFTQGNITFTNNSLDLALSGSGFFQLDDGGSTVYTRAGNFSLDSSGFIVNNDGLRLLARAADSNGAITGAVGPLQLQTSNVSPQATQSVSATLNFDSRSTATDASWSMATGVPDVDGYNDTTSTTIYDSLGNDHTISMYFSKTAANNTWNVRTLVDGNLEDTTTVTFNADGSYNTPANIAFTFNPGGGATAAQPITVDLSASTQFGANFATSAISQDGFTSGQLLGVDIDSSGIIFARFSNGQSTTNGQIMLANFANTQGLQPLGDTSWAETFSSGAPVVSEPGTAGLGLIQSNSLEESNVDLTGQLVRMIIAQRNFQASAQTIQAEDDVTQTIINLR